MVENSSLEFLMLRWWQHDHVQATRTLIRATKALRKVQEEKRQKGSIDFRDYGWEPRLLWGTWRRLFHGVFWDHVFQLCLGVWDKLERHIARALVQQARGEDQCDSRCVDIIFPARWAVSESNQWTKFWRAEDYCSPFCKLTSCHSSWRTV